MRLAKVRIRNFRCYRDEISLTLEDFTALIGKNDAGKSSILEALSIFFEERPLPDSDDACIHGSADDVRIVCEFDRLPASLIIDAGVETSLGDEHLLNAEGRLEIHKIYDCSTKKAKLSRIFAYALHPAAEGMDDLLQRKNKELKKRAKELGVDTEGVDLKVNSQIRQKIWASAVDLKASESEIELDAEDSRKIWDQLKKQLPCFALFKADRPSTDQDEEAQDPMKAAIKEAIREKEAELKAITDHVEREVKAIADKTVEKLKEMDPTLARQLNPRFLPPSWSNVFKVKLTGEEEIPVNKRGSGVRRLILLNFFRAKAEQEESEKGGSGIIYAVEEPETSQHPDNQRMLMHALSELTEQHGCQVIVTTHTPNLGRLLPVASLRYVATAEDGGHVVLAGDDETFRLVADGLGVLADHDVKLFVGVEGVHDISFLKAISGVLKAAGEKVPDLNALEENGAVIFIPCGGASLVHWKSRLAGLNRPEFHLFDRDEEPPAVSSHQEAVDAINARVDCEALLTNKREMENYLHPTAIATARPGLALSFASFDDVPTLAAKAILEASDSTKAWSDLSDDKRKKKVSSAKRWLNREAAAAMSPRLLDESDPHGEVRGWLQEIQDLLG